MKKNTQKNYLLYGLFIIITFIMGSLLQSCVKSSVSEGIIEEENNEKGSSNLAIELESFSGVVIDPEISEANIKVINTETEEVIKIYDTEGKEVTVKTDEAGSFSLSVSKEDINSREKIEIVAEGGTDTVSGENYGDNEDDSIILKAGLEDFTSKENEESNVISPITTLVQEEYKLDRSVKREEVKARVAEYLNIKKEDLNKNPMKNGAILKVARSINLIAINFAKKKRKEAYKKIVEELKKAKGKKLFNSSGEIEEEILDKVKEDFNIELLEDTSSSKEDKRNTLKEMLKEQTKELRGIGDDVEEIKKRMIKNKIRNELFKVTGKLPKEKVEREKIISGLKDLSEIYYEKVKEANNNKEVKKIKRDGIKAITKGFKEYVKGNKVELFNELKVDKSSRNGGIWEESKKVISKEILEKVKK